MSDADAFRLDLLVWYGAMLGAYAAMPSDEREELHAWDVQRTDGVATSDWPGWVKYIGSRPTLPIEAGAATKTPIPEWLRWDVWQRDNFTCQACGSRRSLSCDHIIPESAGGPTTLANLQTLCRSCNSRKGARMPEEVPIG